MASKIDLYDEIGKIMDSISDSCEGAMKMATDKSAKFAVKELKKVRLNTTGRGSGAYSKGWTYAKRGYNKYVVYNKSHYRLTHLLEKGHVIKKKGIVVGEAQAFPHIANVESYVEDAIEQYLFDELNKKSL